MNEMKMNDRINFFPFTHGDAIEQQREIVRDI